MYLVLSVDLVQWWRDGWMGADGRDSQLQSLQSDETPTPELAPIKRDCRSGQAVSAIDNT